jgi:pantothenate kinase-related protein Tda10
MPEDDKKAARHYIETGIWKGVARPPRFGKLILATRVERVTLEQTERLIGGYLDEPSRTRPLCLAVFGPPGSGKSSSVKEIRKRLQKQWKPST